MNIKSKRANIEKIVLDTLKIMEPDLNYKEWKTKFSKMSDEDFTRFMNILKEGKEVFSIKTPNMKVTLNFHKVKAAADYVGVSLFQRLRKIDPITKLPYLTNEKYFISEQMVRRMQQTAYEKLSVPTSDKKIDGLTGQVTGDDRSSSITYPEIQGLKAQGFKAALEEMVVARGGNLAAYAQMKQSLKDIGEASLEEAITPDSISRSTVILAVYLMSMGYDTNLLDRSFSKPVGRV